MSSTGSRSFSIGCRGALTTRDDSFQHIREFTVKYNQTHGVVRVKRQRVAGTAEFTIFNTGPGIPPGIPATHWGPFYRGGPAHGNFVKGCGLGLSIAKWIVGCHLGSIHIKSRPGQLTTAIVRLPIIDSK